MKIVEMAILSTDLAVYFKKKKEFVRMVENGEFGWQGEDKKERMLQNGIEFHSNNDLVLYYQCFAEY